MGFIRRSLLDDHSEDDDDHKSVGNTLSHNKWIMVAVFLSIFFLVFVYYATIGMISKRRRSATSRQTRDLQEEELNQNPNRVDHPIWYIRTVGLEESIIDSITVCRYIKGEGLIEDTECSVCLSEFEDDESLKLLPKCSHAFHISCIDTWLRSHVNCPLCRAPIISNSTSTLVDSNASNPSGEYQMENNTTNTDPTRETQPDERTEYSDDEEEDASMNSMKKTCCNPENHREGNSLIENEDGIRPMRRSASVASSYDRSIMHNSEDIHLQMDERSLISMNPESIEAFDSELTESYGERRLIRECNGNKNVFDLMNLSSQISMGQKQPFIMQRSLSSGAKFFLSHYRRNRSSILPL